MTVMNGRMNGKKSQVKPEELIVNELIEAIESGNTKLWRKEWTDKGGFRNVLSGHEYKGSNPALLCLQSSIRGWHLPLFKKLLSFQRAICPSVISHDPTEVKKHWD